MLIPSHPIVAVVQLATQPPSVLHQVVLRPDKVKVDLIRLGETPGDEANGWIRLQDITIVQTIGRAVEVKDGQSSKWVCEPE